MGGYLLFNNINHFSFRCLPDCILFVCICSQFIQVFSKLTHL